MKKLVISLAIASALGLSGCDSETINDVTKEVPQDNTVVPSASRVVFDPSNGVLSVPNDLLFSGTTDGTLNIPVDDPSDFQNPQVAINALDGWSTTNPFVLNIALQAGRTLDANSVFNPASVHVYEAVMGGDLTDTDCTALTRGLACKIVNELTFGQDFVAQAQGSGIAIAPLKPLKPKTTYIVALTNNLQDSTGQAIAGSTTYELVKQDITTKPLGSESQLMLQGLVNSFETAVASQGVEKENIIYTMAMTTQSTTDVLDAIKGILAMNAQMGNVPTIGVQDTTLSVADALAGQIPAEADTLYRSANLLAGTITLPYYSAIPTAENPLAPYTESWKALCDSAAMLAGLAAANPAAIPADAVSPTDAQCIAISQAQGLPAPGLRDLGIDAERNLTKYNPVPKATSNQSIAVQMTTPDLTYANLVRASMGLPALTEPAAGWPVAILQHGITSKKEDMLAITGILSVYGIATVAINHPLHGDPSLGGSRGFDLNGDGTDEINTSTHAATDYMNLANLLATRDNLRQSTADLLGLRLGVNFLGGVDANNNPIKVDPSKVYFLGHSLGAITGVNFVAEANSPLDPAIDPMFHITANTQAMPGAMVANFLFESGAFGNTVKSNLLYAGSAEFKAAVDAQAAALNLTPASAAWGPFLEQAYLTFASTMTAEQQAEVAGIFAQFAFAAQTVTDSGDPANYAQRMAATNTPTHVIEVVGNGSDNLSDQVIPNTIAISPTMGGTEGVINLLGLSGISATTMDAENPVSGAVRFLFGHHGSILSPATRPEAPDAAKTSATTTEMQTQVANFFDSNGHLLPVVDSSVVMQ